jgi:hypothetical protein
MRPAGRASPDFAHFPHGHTVTKCPQKWSVSVRSSFGRVPGAIGSGGAGGPTGGPLPVAVSSTFVGTACPTRHQDRQCTHDPAPALTTTQGEADPAPSKTAREFRHGTPARPRWASVDVPGHVSSSGGLRAIAPGGLRARTDVGFVPTWRTHKARSSRHVGLTCNRSVSPRQFPVTAFNAGALLLNGRLPGSCQLAPPSAAATQRRSQRNIEAGQRLPVGAIVHCLAYRHCRRKSISPSPPYTQGRRA